MKRFSERDTDAHKLSSMGKVRQTPEYQQKRVTDKQNFYVNEANSWLKEVASLFDTDTSGYNTELFNTRAKTADTLKSAGSSLLSRMEENRAVLGDDFISQFRKTLEEQSKNLDVASSYYKNANPYEEKYRNYSVEDLAETKGILMQAPTKESPQEVVERKKEIDMLSLLEMHKQSESKDFSSTQFARKRASDIYAELEKAKDSEETAKKKKYADYLTSWADDEDSYIDKGREAIDNGAFAADLSGILDEDMDTVRYLVGRGDENALNNYLFNYYNLKSEEIKNGRKTGSPQYTKPLMLAQAYYDAQEGLAEYNDNHDEFANLTADEKDFVYYMVGQKLIERGYTSYEEVKSAVEDGSLFDFGSGTKEWEEINRLLTQKNAEHRFEDLQGDTIRELIYKAGSGLASNPRGIYRALAFGNKDISYSESELVSQMIHEDLADDGFKLPDWLGGYSIGQAAGSMLESYGQMAPSMALGAIPVVGPVLSEVSFGMSAGGNAKMDLMREGYDEITSTAYGMLVGAAEAGLQHLLGGIKIGNKGTASKLVDKFISGIKNGFLKYVAKVGMSGGLEGIEEGLQEILAPTFKAVLTSDVEALSEIEIGNVLFASLQGFVMGEGMSTVQSAVEMSPKINRESTEADIDTVNRLIEEGLTKNAGTDAYKISASINQKIQAEFEKAVAQGVSAEEANARAIKKVTKEDFVQLYELVTTSPDSDTEISIERRLRELGEKGDITALTQAIYKKAHGIKLSTEEKSVLKKSAYGQRVLNEYKYAGTEGYSDGWTEDIDGAYARETFGRKKTVVPVGESAETQSKVEAVSETPLVSQAHPRGIAAEIKGKDAVGITGIASKTETETVLSTSKGETVKASDVTFDDPFIQDIMEQIESDYDTNTANAVLEAAQSYREYKDGKVGAGSFLSAFDTLYRVAEKEGLEFSSAMNRVDLIRPITAIGTTAARSAMNAGLVSYEARYQAKETAQKANKKTAAVKKATVTVGEGVELSKGVKNTLEKIAALAKADVVVENFSEGDESRGYYVDGVIHLNAKKVSDSTSVYVAIHEVVHHLKANNAKGYSVLEKYITNYLSKKGHNVDNMVKALQRSRAKYGEKLSYEDALEELVCNTMSEIATDEEAMSVFLELNESERKNLISVLRDIANKIREWARSLTGKEYRRLVTESETLRHLANELNKQLKSMEVQKNTAESGARYSINDNFYVQYSNWDGKTIGFSFVVGNTSSALIKAGIPNKQIRWDASKIKSLLNKHNGMSDNVVMKIPELLEHPVVVIDSKKNPDARIIMGDLYDNNNKLVTVVLLLTPTSKKGNVLDVVKISSAEGRSHIKSLFQNSDGSYVEVRYIDKKRIQSWLNVNRLQLPLHSFNSDSNNSIPNSDKTVKKNSYADELVLRAEEYFGTTRNWNETGYILTNGRQLDFSGKKLGAPGGERTVDHREILDSYDEETQDNMSGVEAMVDFMRSGNIRIMPETQGVNLSVQPNKEQERTLRDFISRSNGEVVLDIDDDNGKTVVSVEYPRGTSASKILADIRRYFEDGTEPYVSEVSKYRYSYADEEVDLWGLLEPEEDSAESTQRSEYLDGFVQTAATILEKTRGVTLSEGRTRGLANNVIRRYTGKYNTPLAQQVEDILTVATANQSVSGYDVVGEIAAVMKKAITESEYTVDQFRAEREDVYNIMRGYGRVYLNEEQMSNLKDNDRSLVWFRGKLFGRVQVVSNQKFVQYSAAPFEEMYRHLANQYPEWFDKDVPSVLMPMELLRQLEELRPRMVGFEEVYMQSADEVAVQMASDLLTRVVDAKYQANKTEELRTLRRQNSENRKKWLENQDSRKHLQNIERYAASMIKQITEPTKTNGIPQKMQTPVRELLTAFDFTKGHYNRETGEPIKHDQHWSDKMQVIAGLLETVGMHQQTNLEGGTEGIGYMDVDPYLVQTMREFAESAGGKKLSQMSAEEIGTLDGIMMRLKNAIGSASKLHQNEMAAQVQELGENTIEELKLIKKGLFTVPGKPVILVDKVKSGIDQSLRWTTADAFTVEKMFGKYGGSVMAALYKGYEKVINNIDVIKQWVETHIDVKKVQEWRKDARRVVLQSGDTVTLTVPQIMELYVLNNRTHAHDHIYGGGIVIEADIVAQKMSRKNRDDIYRSIDPYVISPSDIAKFTAQLTDEQIKLADMMQRYLTEDMGRLGNEVTLKRFLYKVYNEKCYWPIKVVETSTKTTDQTINFASLYAVANPGFSKKTVEGANNAIVIHDIFDSFSQHCGNMALMNGLSIPLSDALKWYNYTNGNTGVKGEMREAFSKHANDWFIKFLSDLNNQQIKASPDTKIFDFLIKNAKSAAIWMNGRVVVQQFTAYTRAYAVLDAKYLANPQALLRKGGVEKALKYCPIAKWKSWGFFTTDVGRSMKDIILPVEGVSEKVKSAGFWATAKADEMTWGALWNACELQVLEENKGLERDTEECNLKTAELLTKVVNETQVVDTPFHRAQIRRNAGVFSKLISSFMDEPLKSYNLLRNAFASKDKKKIGRAVVSFVVTAALCGALESAWDVFIRNADPDDEDEFWKKYLKTFIDNTFDNLNLLNLHPLISEMWSISEGWSSAGLDEIAIKTLASSLSHWIKRFSGESNRTVYSDVYETAKAISYLTGIGIHTVMRDVVGIVNHFLPAGQKWSNTAPTKTKLANEAVNSLLKGDKAQYDSYYEDILKKCGGDNKKAQELIKKALSETDEIQVIYNAYVSGNRQVYEENITELEKKGFEFDTIMKALKSYGNKQKEDTGEDKEPEAETLYDTTFMIAVLESGDTEGFLEIVEHLKADGVSESSMKSKVTNTYKADYVEAYLNGEAEEQERIKGLLQTTGFYEDLGKTLTDWVVADLKKQYLASEDPDERAKIRTQLYNTGKWDSYSELDKRLKAWRESE